MRSISSRIVAISLVLQVAALVQTAKADSVNLIDALQQLSSKSPAESASSRYFRNLATALAKADTDTAKAIKKLKVDTAGNDAMALDLLQKAVGKALEKYFPALATVLTSATVAGFAVFLTSETISEDPMEVLRQPAGRTGDELHKAASMALKWPTEGFAKLTPTEMGQVLRGLAS